VARHGPDERRGFTVRSAEASPLFAPLVARGVTLRGVCARLKLTESRCVALQIAPRLLARWLLKLRSLLLLLLFFCCCLSCCLLPPSTSLGDSHTLLSLFEFRRLFSSSSG
jgi:hypothetical protein